MLKKLLVCSIVFLSLIVLPTFIIIGSKEEAPDMELYLLSNDVHVGLVLPLKNEVVDWSEFFDLSNFQDTGEWFQLGWGDQRFYFDVPTWDNLTIGIAIDALLLPGTPVIHVDFLLDPPRELETKVVKISHEKYRKLVEEIKSRFIVEGKRPILITGKGYSTTDNFYRAEGTYSVFRTCNNWTAELLGHVGLRRPLWSPAKYGLLFAY